MNLHKRNTFSRLLLALAFLAGLLGGQPAQPAWAATGDAILVLGQADFTHGDSNRGGGVAANTLNAAASVAVDPANGKVFVADQENNRVLRFASFSALTNGAAAEGVLGQADFTSTSANRGGDVAANTLSNPFGVALDKAGRLWVADTINNRLLRFDSAASKANGADADGVLGQADFTHGDINRGGDVVTNTLYYPEGAALDASGLLWVVDYYNHRLLRFDAAASKDDGADADGVLGQADFTHNSANRGGSVAANTLYYPSGIGLDASERLWVADYYNHRLLRFDAAASKDDGADADGVLGQADFTHNSANRGGSVAANTLYHPYGVSLDASGLLWVAYQFNHRLLRFDAAASKDDGADADSVLGQADFTQNGANRGASVAANTLYYPFGVTLDEAGRLWVADRYNHRVLVYGMFKCLLPAILRNYSAP
jgi:sugar lactone lactonase YvrE